MMEKTSIENQQVEEITMNSGENKFNGMSRETFRERLTNTLEKRLFCTPSFEIYGGVAGLYDYGPPGWSLKNNVLALWEQHFVLEEDMLQVASPYIPGPMVRDVETRACHRADHLLKAYCKDKLEKDLAISDEEAAELKQVLAVLDDLSIEQLGAKLKEYAIVAPDTKNPLSDPYLFMFSTSTGIGPGCLRPETAQGMFVHFNDNYNGNQLPFAAAQIGQVFRNELSARQGLLGAHVFTLAEIGHFVDPDDKSHPRYSEVSNLGFLMLPRGQSAKRLSLGDAVSKGIVNNQTLAYFIGRVYLFLTRLGIDEKRLRFRQHLPNEIAHYATDCWDAEIECSYGWIECVGIADRSAYDLRAYSEKSGVPLVAQEKYANPKEVEKLVITPNKKVLGPAFKGDHKMVVESLEAMNENEAMEMKATLESKGQVEFEVCKLEKLVTITKNMLSITKEKKTEHLRTFTPSVIEPFFDIESIIYCLYEHSFYTRPSKAGDKQLNVFRFNPLLAPIKCAVFPLVRNDEYEKVAERISKSLTAARIDNKQDFTGTSIGKKYARADELGLPFAVTVDSKTLVTIRERDSKDQIRVDVDEVAPIVKDISEGRTTWADISQKYSAQKTNLARERDSKEQIRANLDAMAAILKDISEGRTTWADILQKIPCSQNKSCRLC